MVNETISFESLFIEFIKNLPPDISSSIGTFITILKTAGILFIIYVVFLIVKGIFDIRRSIMIKRILEKVNKMDEKLDTLLQKKLGKKR